MGSAKRRYRNVSLKCKECLCGETANSRRGPKGLRAAAPARRALAPDGAAKDCKKIICLLTKVRRAVARGRQSDIKGWAAKFRAANAGRKKGKP